MSTTTIPDDVQQTIDDFEAELDSRLGTVSVPTGPMPNSQAHSSFFDGEAEDDLDFTEVRAYRKVDPYIGDVVVVEVVLDLDRDDYMARLKTPDDPASDGDAPRSMAEVVYREMDDHGILRPDGTPKLGVKVGVPDLDDPNNPDKIDEDDVAVQGYVPIGDQAVADGGSLQAMLHVLDPQTLALYSIPLLGMATGLKDYGEEYTCVSDIGASSLDVGLHNDGTDALAEGDDIAQIGTEPSDGNYARQTAAVTVEQISGDVGIDNDSQVQFDVTNTTGTVAHYFTVANFTSTVIGSDGGATDHLANNAGLSQSYDLSNYTDLDLNAGDGAGTGVGWTL